MKPYQPDKLPLAKLDWRPFIRYIGPANAAIARYDGMLQAILNPDLLLSPLMVQEAVLSSKIEGTQATLEEVMAFEGAGQSPKEESKRNDIQEIINYRTAMRIAIEEIDKKPVSINLLHKMHYVLLDSVRGRDKARGEFRKIQNYIGKQGTPIEQAKFIPPDPLTVMEHMSNLEKYVHYKEQDTLVQMAIVHAQFEMVHPYVDGNGRLGRIIIPLVLYGKQVLSSPMFYLSAYLESHREEYYERLNAISRKGDWTGWVTFFLKATIEQARINTEKVKSILDLYEVKKRRGSEYAIQTVDTLFKVPSFTPTRFIAESKIPKKTAMRILQVLEKNEVIEILIPAVGRTPGWYRFSKLLKIIRV